MAMFVQVGAQVLILLLIARAVLSWLPASVQLRSAFRPVYQTTDAILGPIRRVLPTFGGLDFSPMVAILLIQLAARLLTSTLAGPL